MDRLVLGLDIGTQGARAVVTDFAGEIAAAQSVSFSSLNVSGIPGHKEQRPSDWWDAAKSAVCACMGQIDASRVEAIAIDGTSGTVVPLDGENNPIGNALMYNDARSGAEAEEVRKKGGAMEEKLGYVFNSSYALPKILWLLNHGCKAKGFVHQTDYIVGKLTGDYSITDYSNALKTGYDLVLEEWPQFIFELGIRRDMLSKVVAPGKVIGVVSAEAAAETGLSAGTKVVSGATDGYSSALSAGISEPGDWASIIGTTFVLKGIEKQLIVDPQGRIYSHKHPQGYWLIGGASNVGGKCLNDAFGKERFEELNREVAKVSPTGVAAYPLTGTGERFPFVSPQAEGFFIGDVSDDAVRYASLMEGVGYVERLTFEMLEGLGCESPVRLYTAGGACKSPEWLQVRANILGKELYVPFETDAAMGTALLASLAVRYDTLKQASEDMIRIRTVVKPDGKDHSRYDDAYALLKEELKRRRYI